MIGRRSLLGGAAAATGALWLPAHVRAQGSPAPVRGGTLVIGPGIELTTPLTSAVTTAGLAQIVSGKLFDGLLTYDEELRPVPQLATRWEEARDGRTITFHLRPGVKWHDGQPFTSADVAFSLLEVWRKYHSRGRSSFAYVTAVDTPDPLTAVIRLSQPCPFLMTVLSSPLEAQVIPKHIYGNGEILSNPALNAPVGSGPFKFVKWERGSHVVLERNPLYWDAPRPYLDRLIFRFVPDAAANAAALETGDVHIGTVVPLGDVERLRRNPRLRIIDKGRGYTTGVEALGFNLDRPVFRDVRVRRAFAHALDRDFAVKNIWHGLATPVHSPIPPAFPRFASDDVPHYPFDLAQSEKLLEEAGLPRKADGIRLTVSNDQAPTGPLPEVAQNLRANLARIGVRLTLRSQDFGEFVNRVYTRRDFETAFYGGNAGPDPAIGVQRFYWSKNFKPGVAFSNAEHYVSADTDRLLEAGQTETDPVARKRIYIDFQRRVQTDLPRVPFMSSNSLLVVSQRVKGLPAIDPVAGNLATTWLAAG